MPNDFTFQNTTKVYFGRDQLKNLPAEIQKYGDSVLLVYGGRSLKTSGLYDRILSVLQDAGIQVFELAGVEPNPRYTTVNTGAALCKEHGISAVLGAGGGSVIDCSKAIAATALADTDNVWDLVEGKVPWTQALPVIAMPTMASTGSEMDKSCVLSRPDLNIKKGINGEAIRPKAAFLNPENTFGVSAFQTACGGFDILTHFLDVQYFVNAEKYPLQSSVVETLIRTIKEQLEIVLKEPENYTARASLLWGASWALNSFCTSGFSQPPLTHALEQFSAFYDIPHGLGLSILLPRWMEYLLEKDPGTASDIARLGSIAFGIEETDDPEADARQTIHALDLWITDTLHLPHSLQEAGIGPEKFAEMAEKACYGRDSLKGYRELSRQDILRIYGNALDPRHGQENG